RRRGQRQPQPDADAGAGDCPVRSYRGHPRRPLLLRAGPLSMGAFSTVNVGNPGLSVVITRLVRVTQRRDVRRARESLAPPTRHGWIARMKRAMTAGESRWRPR